MHNQNKKFTDTKQFICISLRYEVVLISDYGKWLGGDI